MITPLATRVRLCDTDATGCIEGIALLVLFEAARADGLRGVGLPYEEILARGLNALTIEAKLTNQECARLDDLLFVHMWPTQIGRLRFSFEYEVRREGDQALIATGQTTHICLDSGTGQPARLPDWMREGLHRLEPEGQDRSLSRPISSQAGS
jgi:acyl-CoA thioester hydrolase